MKKTASDIVKLIRVRSNTGKYKRCDSSYHVCNCVDDDGLCELDFAEVVQIAKIIV